MFRPLCVCISAFLVVVTSAVADEAKSSLSVKLENATAPIIVVSGLDEKTLGVCAKRAATSDDWAKAVTVKVAVGDEDTIRNRQAMLGSWSVADKQLVFTPKFPLTEGLEYRVTIYESTLLDPSQKPGKAVVHTVRVSTKALARTTRVVQLYPTRNVLPENQLKFYVHFSAPMRRGDAYANVRLVREDGKQVEYPFLELDEELWDPAGKRLTLLFDPGRVKRGLKPREEAGPILEEGKTFTFFLDAKFRDENGQPLAAGFKKTFKVIAPDNDPPDTKKWKLTPPTANTKTALDLRFPDPMDHALLHRVIRVVNAEGKPVLGDIQVSEEETRWQFTPKQAWAAGSYKLVAETILEDMAANRIGRPFELDVFRPIPKKEEARTAEVPFEVK